MFAIILDHFVSSFSAVFDFHVVPSHEGDGVPCLVPGVHVCNCGFAVEGDGLLSLAGQQLQIVHLVAVSLVVDIKAIIFQFSNPHVFLIRDDGDL